MSYSDQEALAYQAFRQSLGKGKHRRANCPFCPTVVGKMDTRTSMAFNIQTTWYQCWRCGTKGKLREIPAHILVNAVDLRDNEVRPMEQPDSTYRLWDKEGLVSHSLRRPRKYMKSRGIDRSVWEGADIHACVGGSFAGRVIVPIKLASGGPWFGYVARDWSNKKTLRYRYPKGMARGKFLFNQEALTLETSEPLLIVEGVFDALPYWPNAAACLGKPSEEQRQLMLEATRPLVIAFDGDAHNEGWSLGLWLQFQGVTASSVRLPPKSDPNDVDKQWLIEAARDSLH